MRSARGLARCRQYAASIQLMSSGRTGGLYVSPSPVMDPAPPPSPPEESSVKPGRNKRVRTPPPGSTGTAGSVAGQSQTPSPPGDAKSRSQRKVVVPPPGKPYLEPARSPTIAGAKSSNKSPSSRSPSPGKRPGAGSAVGKAAGVPATTLAEVAFVSSKKSAGASGSAAGASGASRPSATAAKTKAGRDGAVSGTSSRRLPPAPG